MSYKIAPQMEEYRLIKGNWKSDPSYQSGLFMMPHQSNMLNIVATDGEGMSDWEHVSVSLKNRAPNWNEMCLIKAMFWDDEDAVVQFHPPKFQHSNNHPFCLHLFRNPKRPTELPESILVGLTDQQMGKETA